MDLVRGVRNLKTEMDVPPAKKAKVFIVSANASLRKTFEDNTAVYSTLAGFTDVEVFSDEKKVPGVKDCVSAVIPGATAYLPLSELVDMAKERERLEKGKDPPRG